MKTTALITALSCLAMSAQALADTKVSFGQFVGLAASHPNLILGSDEKTTKDPVSFNLTIGKTTVTTDADPAALFQAIRAKSAPKTYTSAGLTFTQNYGILTVSGVDPAAPAIYDLERDIVENETDPADGMTPGEMSGNVDNQYKPLSIVGSIVSVRLSGDSYGAGAAHPNNYDTVMTVDVSKLEKQGESISFAQPNLVELVDETSLVEALKADKFLNSKLSAKYRKQLKAARTIQQVGDIAESGLLDGGSCYDLGIFEGKIGNFAIYDYNPAKNIVSVRITMEAAAHACAGAAPTQMLGLAVKPRTDLELMLRGQVQNKTGLLMKDAK